MRTLVIISLGLAVGLTFSLIFESARRAEENDAEDLSSCLRVAEHAVHSLSQCVGVLEIVRASDASDDVYADLGGTCE